MLVWLASYPRSGNHLLRALLKRCFDLDSYEIYQKETAPPDVRLAAAIGARSFDDAAPQAFVDRARGSDELFLVKTHDLVPATDRCIYIVRDGRAVFASFQNYLAEIERRHCSLASLIEGKHWPGKWHEHVERFLARDPAKTLVLTYEELSSARPPLEKIGAFLNVPVRRASHVSFDELRSINAKIFHTGHNADGIATVERDQSELFWRICGETMRRLGYSRRQASVSGKPRKVFFLHLPKCAGTSVWEVLRQLVGKERMFQVYSQPRAQMFSEMDFATRNALRVVGGHSNLAYYRSLLDLSQYFSITTFREPVERALSEYHYARGNPNHSQHELMLKWSLRDFLEAAPNPVSMMLCGKPDAAAAAAVVRNEFDCWALMDELPDLVATVSNHLGKKIPPVPHVNVGPRSVRGIAIDDEDRALVQRFHGADIELYDTLRRERGAAGQSAARSAKVHAVPSTDRSGALPVFHVVTPTYNVERYLEETIRSVVTQAGEFDVRYHIQDGGSEDRTLTIARAWQARIDSGEFKPRCRQLRMTAHSARDGGMYDAISRGFRQLAPQATDIATWINGDDCLADGALAAVASAFRDMPDVELVGGRNAVLDARGEPLVYGDLPRYPRRSVAAGLHDGRHLPFVMQEGTFWRAGLWQRVGGVDISFRLAGDWDLWMRFAAETEYVTLDAITGFHRRRPGQMTENLRAYYREIDERLKGETGERERLFREYQDAERPDSHVPAGSFPARFAHRDEHGRWVSTDRHGAGASRRALAPVDGDWTVVSGFDDLEGPFPDQGIDRPFHWAIEGRAVLQVFSARAGKRTLSLRLGSMARNQTVGVRVNGRRVTERRLERRYPKATRLDLHYDFDAGPSTIEIEADRWTTTTQGRRLGVMLYGVGFWRGGSQVSWFKRLVPKPLRAYI